MYINTHTSTVLVGAGKMNKNAIISMKILAKMNDGLSVREAIDAVLGAGTFEQVAGDVYDALRAQA